MKNSEQINLDIKENELSATDWALWELAWELYWWVDLFNTAFFKNQPVPVPALSFEKTTVRTLGRYVTGRNAFGIKENINLNSTHLKRPLWEILATLLHEMCHSWQATHGTPSKSWFHNKEFQQEMLEIGIQCDHKGRHKGLTDPFMSILERHGISLDLPQNENKTIRLHPNENSRGTSKLKKWSCGCTNARVATKNFLAKCLKCGKRFQKVT